MVKRKHNKKTKWSKGNRTKRLNDRKETEHKDYQ
jgi:hypothetical protein